MPEFDSAQAHPARMYDYLLGGQDNFEADRAAIAGLLKVVPSARTGARLVIPAPERTVIGHHSRRWPVMGYGDGR